MLVQITLLLAGPKPCLLRPVLDSRLFQQPLPITAHTYTDVT